jgi:hypothetical protein
MKRFLSCVWVLAGALACSAPPPKCDGGDCAAGGGGGTSGTGGGGGAQNCPDTRSPPNLVTNPGFECGTTGWNPAFTGAQFTVVDGDVHSGQHALQVNGTTTVPSAWSDSEVVPVVGLTYCISAWARGKAASFQVEIRSSAGSSGSAHEFSSPLTGSWVRVPPVGFSLGAEAYTAQAGDTRLQFRVDLRNPGATDYAIVDDVEVWESPDGGCRER